MIVRKELAALNHDILSNSAQTILASLAKLHSKNRPQYWPIVRLDYNSRRHIMIKALLYDRDKLNFNRSQQWRDIDGLNFNRSQNSRDRD